MVAKREGGATALFLISLAIITGCGTDPSPYASSAPGPGTPRATRSASTTAIPTSAPEQLNLQWHSISQKLTTPLLEVRTDGTQICWSAGPEAKGNFAPDLYCYRPGGRVAKVFANPNRDSNLSVIAVAKSWYAFAEQNERVFGAGGWRLWLLHAGSSPIEVDRTDGPGGMQPPPPSIALTDRWLVWATFHQGTEGPRSLLRAIDLSTLVKRTLDEGAFERIQFWFPSLDGDRLAYGTVEQSGTSEDWHVYLASMTATWHPARLDNGGAAQPVLTGGTVIWKQGGDGVFDWGALTRYSIATGDTVSISFDPQPAVDYPSAGSRFAAAWGRDDTKFYLYDLSENRLARIIELDPHSTTGYVRPTVSGRLVAVIRGTTDPSHPQDSDVLQLLWAELPQ